MARTAAVPKVPGAPVAEQSPQVPGAPESAETTAPVAQDVGQDAAAEAETVTVSKASLEALLARVQAMESNASAASAVKRVANPGASLPDQDTINPDEIASPVLTKQGWVVPTKFGANPNAQKGL